MVPCRFYRIIDQRGPTTDNINTIHMMEITELIDYLLPQTGNSPLNGIKDQISFCFVIYNLPNKVRVEVMKKYERVKALVSLDAMRNALIAAFVTEDTPMPELP